MNPDGVNTPGEYLARAEVLCRTGFDPRRVGTPEAEADLVNARGFYTRTIDLSTRSQDRLTAFIGLSLIAHHFGDDRLAAQYQLLADSVSQRLASRSLSF